MPQRPSTTSPVPVTPSRPGALLRDYAADELTRAIACLGWRGGRLHEGVHQARKSLRRARATLALGASALAPAGSLVDRELRKLNRGLSALRDAHALASALAALAERSKDADEAALLRRARNAAARERAHRARAECAGDPGMHARRVLIASLLGALRALPWDDVDAATIRAALARSRTRADDAGRRAGERGKPEDWHRWRRRVRRLSQQQRALGRHSAANRHDKRIAELLGEAQDRSLVQEHCGRGSPFAGVDRAPLKAMMERELARLRGRVRRLLATPSEAPAPA
ncbi:MAG TPA: CHAD domain-containing protein [Dokdonella sp.]|nr:CHAD domain-containing protein [Dokdonella sp.]